MSATIAVVVGVSAVGLLLTGLLLLARRRQSTPVPVSDAVTVSVTDSELVLCETC